MGEEKPAEGLREESPQMSQRFEGVENVIIDCRASKVVMKGERADPKKVFKRVQRKSHYHVELISPVLKPPTPPEEPQKPPEKEFRKHILRMKGIESAEPNLANSQVTVKGVMEPKALADYVYKKTGKHAAIVKVDPEKKEEEKPKEKKKSDREKSDAKKQEEDGKESKSGEAAMAGGDERNGISTAATATASGAGGGGAVNGNGTWWNQDNEFEGQQATEKKFQLPPSLDPEQAGA
ncbi:hypothetical protein SASPL_156021 [Salvia splendens]|uniref:HMA domain-containing protein n=1 Tax=Salvia splendens TaxID=180675 RepID=A0A8X8YWI2_SALSN|nr:hypothetical protein SASPL_156021 [Salvia splendens]